MAKRAKLDLRWTKFNLPIFPHETRFLRARPSSHFLSTYFEALLSHSQGCPTQSEKNKNAIQWGFKSQNCLGFKWLKRGRRQMVQYSKSHLNAVRLSGIQIAFKYGPFGI